MSTILEHGAIIVALLNFVFTIGAGAIGVYVKFALAQMQAELRDTIQNAGQEIDERLDRHRRETGETVLAIRTKITDIEMWVRDNYVRLDALDKLDKRLERMEAKIDAMRGER